MSTRRKAWTSILLLLLLFVSGCTGRPYLTKENSYSIYINTPEGETQKIPIQLSWNTNVAVMQKLLLEASFVLSDLQTQSAPVKESQDELSKASQDETAAKENTIILEANFPKPKSFDLTIDNQSIVMEVSSLQIEVDGPHPGRVILNQEILLQGIPNPNLKPAYNEFMAMIQHKEEPKKREATP